MSDLLRGLSDEQLAAYEDRMEAAMLAALEQVMGTIAAHLGQRQTAAALVAHLPGKHDQRDHGRGKRTAPTGGGGGQDVEQRFASAANGDAALDAAPVGSDTPLNRGVRFRGLAEKTPEQKRSIERAADDYRADGFMSISRGLHRRSGLSQQDRKTVSGLDEAMAASALRSDVVVHRGYRDPSRLLPAGRSWDSDLTGATWTDRSFASTSADGGVARKFATTISAPGVPAARPTVMRIVVPKGRPAIQLSRSASRAQGESEMLLGRGLRYRVLRDRGVDADGVRQLDVEVL